ncbi:MAG: branched-chain amino acid ABC transporter permease [Burkholderiales bacterium]
MLNNRVWLWLASIIFVIVLPLIFKQSFAVSLFCQMGINVIFALSYNMLLGQTGMLSFGHAVYFGLGAFFSIHALNMIGAGTLHYPVSLLPVIGGVVGVLFGVLFGYVTTKRSGTPFAMISMGIGELVFACSLMFPAFFGGEQGISANRVVGEKWLGIINYGPQIQVYYLIALWALISAALMYAFTHTPLGRVATAVRDNSERAQFVGYNPQRVRFLVLVIASGFAGVAGALSAINYEIVTAENVSVQTSGSVLLMTFIGGVGSFYGPIIGAILVTFLQVALSSYTKAWLLYFGLFFLIMVMFAPGGIASLIELHRATWKAKLTSRLMPSYGMAAVPLLIALTGLVGLVEIIYYLETQAGSGSAMKLAGFEFDAAKPVPWLVCLTLLIVGLLLLRYASKGVRASWDGVAKELRAEGVA